MSKWTRRVRSEFTLIGDHDGHVCQFEFVPSKRNPKAIYVVFDGKRVAHRGDPDGPHRKTWVSMVPGFECVDEWHERRDALAVYFEGELLH